MIKKSFIVLCILFFLYLFIHPAFAEEGTEETGSAEAAAIKDEWSVCDEVIGGGILRLNDGRIVCLIGIDVPEPERVDDEEARKILNDNIIYLKDRLRGKKIQLVYEDKKVDFFGRERAYVYLENGEFINAEVIKNGYGFVDHSSNFDQLNEFEKYEIEAQKERKGIWELVNI